MHAPKTIKRKTMHMKTNSRTMAPWVAVLCFGLAVEARAGDSASEPLRCHDEQVSCDTESSEGMPAKCNRASGIVGMEVRNRSDERLGRIKDVVFDLNTERVSYVAISTRGRGLFASGQKLLAVPLNALTAGADGKHLVLDAEMSKVKTAMGFDRNHWPDVNSPSWGAEPFWQEDTIQSGLRDKSEENPEDIAEPEMKMEKGEAAPSASPDPQALPGNLAWPGW
jgi:sporulation protein YlmC with PRC-barrel domain